MCDMLYVEYTHIHLRARVCVFVMHILRPVYMHMVYSLCLMHARVAWVSF